MYFYVFLHQILNISMEWDLKSSLLKDKQKNNDQCDTMAPRWPQIKCHL